MADNCRILGDDDADFGVVAFHGGARKQELDILRGSIRREAVHFYTAKPGQGAFVPWYPRRAMWLAAPRPARRDREGTRGSRG